MLQCLPYLKLKGNIKVLTGTSSLRRMQTNYTLELKYFFSFEVRHIIHFVRLGPSPKLKLQLKGLDQRRTLNSPPPPTTNIRFFQFQDTHSVENQSIILS